MSDDTNFVPRLDGTGSLGRTDKRWNEVHAKTYHGDGSNLSGTCLTYWTETPAGHLLPNIHASGYPNYPGYDIGSADYKVRHLFLSDNSLWVGDNHKVSIENGKAKFKKMGLSVMPTELAGTSFSGDVSQLGISGLKELATQEGLYADPDFEITDLLTAGDFEDDMGAFEKVQLPLTTQAQEEISMPPLGTMIYDTNENVVKVVADDGNGTLAFRTLAFM